MVNNGAIDDVVYDAGQPAVPRRSTVAGSSSMTSVGRDACRLTGLQQKEEI